MLLVLGGGGGSNKSRLGPQVQMREPPGRGQALGQRRAAVRTDAVAPAAARTDGLGKG
jgi:hypothetical protein